MTRSNSLLIRSILAFTLVVAVSQIATAQTPARNPYVQYRTVPASQYSQQMPQPGQMRTQPGQMRTQPMMPSNRAMNQTGQMRTFTRMPANQGVAQPVQVPTPAGVYQQGPVMGGQNVIAMPATAYGGSGLNASQAYTVPMNGQGIVNGMQVYSMKGNFSSGDSINIPSFTIQTPYAGAITFQAMTIPRSSLINVAPSQYSGSNPTIVVPQVYSAGSGYSLPGNYSTPTQVAPQMYSSPGYSYPTNRMYYPQGGSYRSYSAPQPVCGCGG